MSDVARVHVCCSQVGGAEAQVNQKNQEVLGIERDVQRLESESATPRHTCPPL